MKKIKNSLIRSFKCVQIMFGFSKVITITYIGIALLSSVVGGLEVIFLSRLIDSIIEYINTSYELIEMVKNICFYMGSILISSLYYLVVSIMGKKIELSLTKYLTEDVLKKFYNINYFYFENNEFNNTLRRIGQNPQSIVHSTFFSVVQTIFYLFLYFSTIVSIFSLSKLVGIISFLIGIPLCIIEIRITNRNSSMLKEQTPDMRKRDYIQSLLKNKDYINEEKVFNNSSYILEKNNQIEKKILSKRKNTSLNNMMFSLISIIMKTIYVSIIVFISLFELYNIKITTGQFIAIFSSIATFMGSLNTMGYAVSTLAGRTWNLTYYLDFMKYGEENRNCELLKKDNFVIEFKNVYFKYPNSDKEILHNINLKIKSNESLSLIGANGCGKSTLIKLICGLYKPDKGTITINGISVSDIKYEELSKIFYVVFQDYIKFQMSLKESIAMGKNIDSEKLNLLFKKYELHDLINNFDIHLGNLEDDGRNLSEGQWQKIALIRSLINESSFVIMDEPTASLDPITESKVYENFILTKNENNGIILISHRLSSIKITQRIILMDKGCIIADGNHESLMKSCELYKKMYNEQASWYLKEDLIDD